MSQWNKKGRGDGRIKLIKSKEEWERLSLKQDTGSLSEEESIKKGSPAKADLAIGGSRGKNMEAKIADLVAEISQRGSLERMITVEEIREALKDCDGNKAPGPDGFNVNFYKKFWLIVGDEVVGFIKEFFKNGKISRGINKTFIVLIPKVVSPQSLDEYRPISLVNSSYKILAKCLAKRLSVVLPQIISQNQYAFISDRNILDGIMITNELIHAVKRERRKALVIKLDFKKAYDTVS
ncbi:hypothetical protein QQ045_012525 [Rhodiola kirilowii]